MGSNYGTQADSRRAHGAQACSGSAPACLPSTQIKAAAAQVRRLKRNQRKKVESDLHGSYPLPHSSS